MQISSYYRRRWALLYPGKLCQLVGVGEGVKSVLCPACRKMQEHYPNGEVRLSGSGPEERQDIFRLLRNGERRARQKKPLERIMGSHPDPSGWKVETTTEKLAQRLARVLRKARGGKVGYQWSHNNKFVRVVWQKEK